MKKRLKHIDIRFSVEIEVEFPTTDEDLYTIESETNISGWYVGEDGSLDYGLEYKPKINNHLYLNDKTINQIKTLCNNIKNVGGEALYSCGLHVHVDITNFTKKEICNIVKNFMDKQEMYAKKFNTRPDRLDCYCQFFPNDICNMNKIKEMVEYNDRDIYIENEPHNKHHFILDTNIYRHNTLEFRLFNGTLNYKKIIKYVRWAIDFTLKMRSD